MASEMITIIRGSTPTHYYRLPFEYNGVVKNIKITYLQHKPTSDITIEKDENDIQITGDMIYFILTAVETNSFETGRIVTIQIDITTFDDIVLVSDTYKMQVTDNIEEEVGEA